MAFLNIVRTSQQENSKKRKRRKWRRVMAGRHSPHWLHKGPTVPWKNWAGRSLHSLSMGTVWISQVTRISRISAITGCRYPDKSCPPQNQGEEQRSTVKCVRRPWQHEGVLQTEGFPELNSELAYTKSRFCKQIFSFYVRLSTILNAERHCLVFITSFSGLRVSTFVWLAFIFWMDWGKLPEV